MLAAHGGSATPDLRACRRRRSTRFDDGARHRHRGPDRVGRRRSQVRAARRRDRGHSGRRLRRLSPLPRGVLMRTTILTTPRPVPGKLLPTAGALLVLGPALAVFLVVGWGVSPRALGALLWAGGR